MSAHSIIGASSSKRWMACPGSVALSAGIPNRSSEYALEGTAAHQLAESCLADEHDAAYLIGSDIHVQKDGGEWKIPVTKEMAEAVQVYLDFVRKDEPFDTLIEHRFHLKELDEGLFGTADCVQWFPETSTLRVADYKHGQGVAVEAKENPQGLYYALGALLTLRFPARFVEIAIVQPRCAHPDGPIRIWTVGVDVLMDFQHDLLRAVKRVKTAEYSQETMGPEWVDTFLASGDHCKFCPAAGVPGRCKALENKSQAIAKLEFAPMPAGGVVAPWYDPEQLAQALRDMPAVEARIKAIREFAYAEAEAGRCPPGFKLVEKRATTKLRDDVNAEALAAILGVPMADVFKEAEFKNYGDLVGMAPGKNEKERKAVLAPFAVKQSSGHTLAPADDKRAAVKQSAQLDFANA